MSKRKVFKNALCLASIPEYHRNVAPRHGRCQRKANHLGWHRSYSREWNDGSKESKPREARGA